MRVCFVSKEVAGIRGGGIGTYIAEAGKALAAHGHEAWLITDYPGEDRLHELEAIRGFHKVLPVGHGVPMEEREYHFHAQPNYGHAYLVHQTLQRLGVTFDYIEFPDYEAEGLIVFQEQRCFGTYDGTALSVMLHSPTWECFSFDRQEHRANQYIREVCNIEEEAIRIAPAVNSPSRGLRDQALTRLGLERDVGIIRYPMELDPEIPEAPAPCEQLSELQFLYYGRIEPRKGIDELIDAFARMPELELTLIGGDVPYSPYGRSYRDHIQKRASSNVTFLDAIPRDELLARLHKSQVCIFPSLFENWPNTCIEAMSAARVVLGSKHGGMSEMIEDGVSGFHVDGRSADDIVDVIQNKLRAALPRLDEIGKAAAVRMRELSDQKVYCDALERRIEEIRSWSSPAPSRAQSGERVSVVIPFYKDVETIDEAVDSAIAQSHEDLEILIVNDGSPLPNADEILARQSSKDPRITVHSKPNGGLSSARNYGIERASGEFLLFLDADNIAMPDYASAALEALRRNPDSYFVTPHAEHFDHDSGESSGIYNALPFDRSAALMINRFGDAGAFFRRSTFLEHELRYDETLISYEDWALWMDLAGREIAGERVPRTLYRYRVRSDSMMQQDALPNHPALIGLLIHRHFPASSDEERRILTTIFSEAGQSICRITFGQADGHALPARSEATTSRDESESAQVDDAPVMPGPGSTIRHPLRYKLVDEISRLSHKIPGLNRALRGALGGLFRVGGQLRKK